MGRGHRGWCSPVRVWLGRPAPALGTPCPGPGLTRVPPVLQKVHSYGGGLLSADKFQNLFNELDRRVTKEVMGQAGVTRRGRGRPGLSGSLQRPRVSSSRVAQWPVPVLPRPGALASRAVSAGRGGLALGGRGRLLDLVNPSGTGAGLCPAWPRWPRPVRPAREGLSLSEAFVLCP